MRKEGGTRRFISQREILASERDSEGGGKRISRCQAGICGLALNSQVEKRRQRVALRGIDIAVEMLLAESAFS